MKRAWIIQRNEKAVSPVIATILMVAITVVLAAVLYVMVSGLIGGTTASEPNVTWTSPDSKGNNIWEIDIAGVSEGKALENFKVVVFMNGTQEAVMETVAEGTVGIITFEDKGDEGKLTSGDFFRVTCTPASDYEISILWKESGMERGSATWDT